MDIHRTPRTGAANRKIRILSATGVAILILGSAAVRFIAAPALLTLPADLDATVVLAGTARTADLAAAGLGSPGGLGGLSAAATPVTVTNRVRVASTHGDTAVITSESTVARAGNTTLQTVTHTWAVDRRTLQPAPAPPGSRVEPHDGMVIGFPVPPQPRDYPWWDPLTQTTATARYQSTEELGGRRVHRYTVHASGQVKDANLTKSIPARPLVGLASTTDAKLWIDTATSHMLKTQQTNHLTVTVAGVALPVTVFDLKVEFTPQTADTMLRRAQTAERGLDIVRTAIPVVLLGLAVILTVITVRRPAAPTPSAQQAVRRDRGAAGRGSEWW